MVFYPGWKNPGPRCASSTSRPYPINILHWNLNSLLAHNGIRLRCIEALNAIQNYDIIAISESALHKSNSDDDIELKGFVPFRRDLSDDTTHGGIVLYCKDSLAIRERKDLETFSNMLV